MDNLAHVGFGFEVLRVRCYACAVRVARIASTGWGATLILLLVSVAAAIRLASIGAQTVRIREDELRPEPSGTEAVVALIQPSIDDALADSVSLSFGTPAASGQASDYRVFSPHLPPFLSESEALLETLNIAYESGAAAVVVRPDTPLVLERVSAITASGMLTVAIGVLTPAAESHVTVGIDPTDLGRLVRSEIDRVVQPGDQIGYLCGLCAGAEEEAALQMVGAIGSDLEISLQRVDDAELGSIAAAGALLRRGADVVFCDTVEGTVAMAQVLIDSNRVGQVSVIGFGESERVLSLLDDRVIESTVSVDFARITQLAEEIVRTSIRESDNVGIYSSAPRRLSPGIRLLHANGGSS